MDAIREPERNPWSKCINVFTRVSASAKVSVNVERKPEASVVIHVIDETCSAVTGPDSAKLLYLYQFDSQHLAPGLSEESCKISAPGLPFSAPPCYFSQYLLQMS
ncbi:hypothetical protein VNO77_44769 [Canavalia gladiata]|uniref:Uncharacterized protein n=1 Tax=Canavalia gladiata TaxID=3824 RepID=A0AAN9JWL6_CANGL